MILSYVDEFPLNHNGPAIKCVCVGLRMEVVTTNLSSGYPEYSGRHTTEMNKPWRTFCRPGTNFAEHYECRGTRLIGSREQVKVHKVLMRALARSRYRHYESVKVAGVNCKKCDKQMNFIVRVSC